ncbi:hypothetical protein VP1G_07109 [Cytospora mali]|uniref:Uncharacterized protein n=1 Tax=Cytospora mali TaxID=578113 RepID=A0A194V7J7_CYTMA|nr:hypothetical protein VP1G_07109 [Valsa mali var. pyri (nom. inval.)]
MSDRLGHSRLLCLSSRSRTFGVSPYLPPEHLSLYSLATTSNSVAASTAASRVKKEVGPKGHLGQLIEVYRDRHDSCCPWPHHNEPRHAEKSQRKKKAINVGDFKESDITPDELMLIKHPLELVDPIKHVTKRVANISFDYHVSHTDDPEPGKANSIFRVFHAAGSA